MNIPATLLILWLALCIGSMLVAVHKPYKSYPEGETYGHGMWIAGTLILLITVALSYWVGRSS